MTEHAASFPYLSCMLLSPFVGLLVLLCLKNEQKFLIRAVSVVASGISLALSIFTFVAYDKALGGLQFVEKYEWVKTFGITYFVGVEGLNAPMLLLTGIVIFTGCLTMWELEDRTKEYFIWMMALVTGVFGVFMSYDMFFFFLFYEIAVVPMYILILVWGSTRKEYAAMKLTLYLMAGSGLIIPGILLLYSSSGLNTFNMLLLHG
ncbi:MAG: NADH-quinone oxidoreductase subunit M, partial [Proteobacteria bacterium]|nr:NADH-quinone oxidoreductase subunit M [Pseudomonadota bacterium]